jgi:anthranilate synthase component 2
MIILIDNYDSFAYNLVHYLGELGETVVVHRNDQVTVDQVLAAAPDAIVISPGPCDPDRAGICLELVQGAAGRLPLLGVCLGHQSIGQAFGGTVVPAPTLMHGKTSAIRHDGSGVFRDLPQDFIATRYHSLMVRRDDLPDCLAITAESADGVIMGLAHRQLPMHGVQFHPESIASECGHALLRNFLAIARDQVPGDQAPGDQDQSGGRPDG